MQITSLEYQKKDPNRVNLFVDGKFLAGIDANDIIKLNLYNGKEIDSNEISKIIAQSEFGKEFNAALNFLSYRPRSEWEIRDFFRRRRRQQELKKTSDKDKKEISEQTIESVITKLRDLGQINDESFAKWYIDQRITFKPLGQRALKYELLKKGIDKKVIDQVLSPTGEDSLPSELDLALKALSKKADRIMRSISDSDSRYQAKIKLQQFLISRGFGYDTAKEAVEKILKKEYNNGRS